MATKTWAAEKKVNPTKKRRIEKWGDWTGPLSPEMANKHGLRVPLYYEKVWYNDRFSVCLATTKFDHMFGETLHVLIQTAQVGKDIFFGDIMRIKDELFGMERYAIQVFPAQSELIDRSNSYHIHVLSEEMSKMFADDALLAIRYMREI